MCIEDIRPMACIDDGVAHEWIGLFRIVLVDTPEANAIVAVSIEDARVAVARNLRRIIATTNQYVSALSPGQRIDTPANGK